MWKSACFIVFLSAVLAVATSGVASAHGPRGGGYHHGHSHFHGGGYGGGYGYTNVMRYSYRPAPVVVRPMPVYSNYGYGYSNYGNGCSSGVNYGYAPVYGYGPSVSYGISTPGFGFYYSR